MQINEQMLWNPLRRLGFATDDLLSKGAFGAITGRAGVGKTSFLVQLALNAMLRYKSVLHISLDYPVKKINLWYKEVFQHLAKQSGIANPNEMWETILPFRFIMTLQVDGFSVPRLMERLKDLTEQKIFRPEIIIIDGLPFDGSIPGILADLKPVVAENLCAWFTVKTHRHEAPAADGLPTQLTGVKDLFEIIIALQPEGSEILVQALKGADPSCGRAVVRINPSTMLIQVAG